MPMRIAMIAHTNAAWTPHYARHLLARGHQVMVVSFSPDPLPGVDVRYPAPPGGLRLPGPLRFLSMVPRVRALLRGFAPDVVLATYLSSNGMTAALAWRGPLVVSARGGDVLRQAGYLPGGAILHGPMMRYVCRHADLVHTVSAELTDALTSLGVPAGKIRTFPVGVDLSRFAPPSTAGEARRPPGSLICTRRQEPVYGNDVLIEALSRLRAGGHEFRCAFVGGGPLLEEHRARAAALGLDDRVSFEGEVSHARIETMLRSASIYISASTSDGTSSSLLEAMACGLFPVVSRIRANAGWVRDGETGFLFEPGDPDALAAALARAIATPGRVADAGRLNRALVEREGELEANMKRLEEMLTLAAARHRG